MKILLTAALLLLLAPATAHATCATIDNVSNTATWTSAGRTHTATYRDAGGPRLIFSRPVPAAVRAAEAKLQLGAPGPKVRTACVK